jgi:hypothetical protein
MAEREPDGDGEGSRKRHERQHLATEDSRIVRSVVPLGVHRSASSVKLS